MILPCDPKAGYLAHKEEIDAAIARVVESGSYILGPEVEAFEREFADYCESKYCVGVANGTEALQLSLRALGIGPGDEVITVSHTAVATAAAIEMAGASPVFADVKEKNYCIDKHSVEQHLTPRTRAIIAVHLYGHPADLDSLRVLANKHSLYLIEDCAQAHGARYKGKRVGTFGDAASFSFYPTKNLGALGDGGAVVVNDHDLYDKLKLLREYGWKDRYVSSISGFNSRLDELQAAILRVKLCYLDKENDARRKLAKEYDKLLSSAGITLPKEKSKSKHVYHLYVVRIPDGERDNVQAALKQKDIITSVHYPVAVHQQPAYLSMQGPRGLPVTEKLMDEVLSLPIYPQLSVESVWEVSRALCEEL